ncbi:unnamed protein product [Vitrella brassicaformis CCMP3155]|uniref:Uncharacterized protein n=1 Tax=Vitrella brassicaformis (strain CCMP3155) TaxID=1169540 RepID=A0A0G4GD57_VITBC|nr:unnamed protein product [Vitrella brassicaformis CCMP3155]|mmetsp:Transcript_38977/g.111377  ORF Transcript_38977/g.111377 Transcript_38977/m.111377 type:complete len:151 (+) Transcript_38977:888-1340(+)|eukprot:CEM27127.1 unnamed protein product [Vitrella brassicaformis CCMP3155]
MLVRGLASIVGGRGLAAYERCTWEDVNAAYAAACQGVWVMTAMYRNGTDVPVSKRPLFYVLHEYDASACLRVHEWATSLASARHSWRQVGSFSESDLAEAYFDGSTLSLTLTYDQHLSYVLTGIDPLFFLAILHFVTDMESSRRAGHVAR